MSTGSNERVVGDYVGLAALPVHLAEQVQGQFPAPCLLAGADQAAVGYHIALTPTPQLRQRNTDFRTYI